VKRATAIAVGLAVVVVGALVLVLGSSPTGAGTPTPVADLAAITGTWQATDDSKAPAPLVAPVRITFAANGLFVETGCNTGRAPAHLESSVLVTEALIMTRRACEPEPTAQEQWVVEMLESRPSVGLAGGTELHLEWGSSSLVLTLVPDAPEGTAPRV
jgi:heat shock protein HslJ